MTKYLLKEDTNRLNTVSVVNALCLTTVQVYMLFVNCHCQKHLVLNFVKHKYLVEKEKKGEDLTQSRQDPLN